MESYMSLLYFIFTLYMELVTCEDGICRKGSTYIECCVDYWKVDNMCVLCPKGLFGEECSKNCPEGLYGAACRSYCDCESDQTCDVVHGCVGNITELCPKGLYGEECNEICPEGTYGVACEEQCECKTDQICDAEYGCVGNVTEQVAITTPGDVQEGDIPLKYFYITPIVIIWLLCIVALSMRCRKRGNRTIDVNYGDASLESGNYEVLQPLEEQNAEQMMQGHEYIEIIDVDSMYLEPCRPTNADLECKSHEVLPAFEEQNMNEMTVEHECIDIIADDSTYLEPCNRKNV